MSEGVGVSDGVAVLVSVGKGVRDGSSAIAVGSGVGVAVLVGTKVGVTWGMPVPHDATTTATTRTGMTLRNIDGTPFMGMNPTYYLHYTAYLETSHIRPRDACPTAWRR